MNLLKSSPPHQNKDNLPKAGKLTKSVLIWCGDKKELVGIIIFTIVIGIIAFFDKTLVVGIVIIAFLTAITFLIISKTRVKSKTLYLLFIIVLLVHFGTVSFIHYANFQPFSGGFGDYVIYNLQAQEISTRIHQGNFSLEGIDIGHYYPVIIGYIYALTTPDIFIGQLLSVWLAAISVLLVYLIVLEIGSSKKWAFLIALIVCFYPGYLFFGSLLIKDTLVIPLVLAGLFLTLKLIKNFFWKIFLIFYIVLGAVMHLRFYVGYALLFTFIPCWLLLCKLNLKKKFIYGIIIIILLGFLPQFLGLGYYGFKTIKGYLNPTIITFYRETAYTPLSSPVIEVSKASTSGTSTSGTSTSEKSNLGKSVIKKLIATVFPNLGKSLSGEFSSSRGSSLALKTELESPPHFLLNCFKSFIYVSLGPLPWQIRQPRQLLVLLETIPWYFLLFFIIKGAFITLKRERIALPLLVFSGISLGVLALFLANFGIITRIRIPSFIALLCLIPLSFDMDVFIQRFNTKFKLFSRFNITMAKIWQRIS